MKNNKPYFLTFIFAIALIIMLFFFGLQNVLPTNPLEKTKNLTVMKVFPQGWGFFSKSPRDASTVILNTSLELAPDWPNNSPKNLFGVKRQGRTQGIEMGLIYTQVPQNNWERCEGDLSICVSQTETKVTVTNTTPKPYFCGEYVLVTQQPVPWAWSDLIQLEQLESKFVKVESICLVD